MFSRGPQGMRSDALKLQKPFLYVPSFDVTSIVLLFFTVISGQQRGQEIPFIDIVTVTQEMSWQAAIM